VFQGSDNKPTAFIAGALYNENHPIGVVVFAIDSSWIDKIISKNNDLDVDEKIYVFGEDLYYRGTPSNNKSSVQQQKVEDMIAQAASKPQIQK